MSLIIYLSKGFLIGLSFLIPGMSGGTMMILLGVFDEAIFSVSELLKGHIYKLKELCLLGLGIMGAVILISPAVHYLLSHYASQTLSFFVGIVVSGLVVMYQDIPHKGIKIKDVVYVLLGFIFVFLLSLSQGMLFDLSDISGFNLFMALFLLGIPLAVAFILPGISTSFLLLSFGLYEESLQALMNFDLSFLVPLMLGLILGVVVLTKGLEKQLRYHKRRTYLMIIGFILDSLREILVLLQGNLLTLLLWGVLGFVGMFYLQKLLN